MEFIDDPIPREDYAGDMHELGSEEERLGSGPLAVMELVEQPQEPLKPPPFWVSIASKSRFQRLHRAGGCWVKPESCADWKPIFRLEESVADASCKMCWPKASLDQADSSNEGSGSESSSIAAIVKIINFYRC